ncbi:MAG: hypothetical protein FWD76_06070 [Firmicutes bacterium]|nr:hypothetical protein [Bacillota bacterium]
MSTNSQVVPLSKNQKDLMVRFYDAPPIKVLLNKMERSTLWECATKRHNIVWDALQAKCPALVHQIKRSFDLGNNIQSAIFSECVYAQTLANLFDLTEFCNAYTGQSVEPREIENLLSSYQLKARYVYYDQDKKQRLIQAGGYGGVDSALVIVDDLSVYTIEFKEAYAKTSEVDLPKFDERGRLPNTDLFLEKYPQFALVCLDVARTAQSKFFGYLGTQCAQI